MIPGWHTTIFPPYFVAGAIYSGFAMVLTLDDSRCALVPHWKISSPCGMWRHGQADARHRPDCRLRLRDGSFHGLVQRRQVRKASCTGIASPDLTAFPIWMLILCNIAIPQLLWIRRFGSTSAVGLAHFAGGQRGHVAGAFRHRRHQPAPRFSALVLGNVHTRQSGTGRLITGTSASS